MKIGIDARCLEGNRTGVGRYLVNLLQRWAKIAPGNEYILYTKRESLEDDFLKQECFEIKPGAGLLSRKGPIWEQFYLPSRTKRDGIDVFFSPSYTMPLNMAMPRVVTIHDVSFEADPKSYSFLLGSYYRFFAKQSARRAAAVITDSEEPKREIVKHYGVDASKISVFHLAADESFKPATAAAIEETKERLGITGQYVLFVGMLFARRNVPNLIKAFREAASDIGGSSLVIVGEHPASPEIDLARILKETGLENRIVWLPRLSHADLDALYSGARVFAYLSSYEGFGLPVLEAMQCGTPVIAADRSCLPEIAGDAAVMVDPDDISQIKAGIELVLNNENTYQDMKERGLARAREFSWDKTAAATLGLIEVSAGR